MVPPLFQDVQVVAASPTAHLRTWSSALDPSNPFARILAASVEISALSLPRGTVTPASRRLPYPRLILDTSFEQWKATLVAHSLTPGLSMQVAIIPLADKWARWATHTSAPQVSSDQLLLPEYSNIVFAVSKILYSIFITRTLIAFGGRGKKRISLVASPTSRDHSTSTTTQISKEGTQRFPPDLILGTTRRALVSQTWWISTAIRSAMTTTIYILFSFATFVRSFDSTFIHYANIFLNLKSTAPDVNSVHGRVPGIVNLVSIRLHLGLSFQQQ